MRILLVASALVLFALAGCGSSDGTLSDAGSDLTCDGKDAGEPCADGYCWRDGSEKIECRATCFEEGYSCDGGACYLIGSPSLLLCLPAGCKGGCGSNTSCGNIPKCPEGSTCIDQRGTMSCIYTCDDTHPCSEGGVCTDSTLGFSVCVVEEEP